MVVDLIEKTFSWDLHEGNGAEDMKYVFYDGILHHVAYGDMRVKEEDDQRHMVRLPHTNLVVEWRGDEWRRAEGPDDQNDARHEARRRLVTAIHGPWVGMWHNPPDMPDWFDGQHSPQSILDRPAFRAALPQCRAIFTLSEHLATWLRPRLATLAPHIVVPPALFHPTCPVARDSVARFDPAAFLANDERAVVQIGYWQRRMKFIGELDLDLVQYPARMWLYGNVWAFDCFQRESFGACLGDDDGIDADDCDGRPFTMDDVVIARVNDATYDKVLSRNVIIMCLYDTSCNNAIIEAIVRTTPVLVNRHPAAVEYLGDAYPLYFDGSRRDAQAKLADFDLILSAHRYLCDNEAILAGRLTQERFIDDLTRSLDALG